MTRVKTPDSEEINLMSQEIEKYEQNVANSKLAKKPTVNDADDNKTSSKDDKSLSQLNNHKMEKAMKDTTLPVKLLFEDFIERYKMLVFSPTAEIDPTAEHCKLITQKAGIQHCELDNEKIHLSYADAARLNQLRKEVERKIVRAQATVRGFLTRSRSRKMQRDNPSLSKMLDPMGLMRSQFDKLVDSSPTSTLSTRSGLSQPQGTSRKEMEQNVFNALKKNDKKYDEKLKKAIQNLDRNPDLKIIHAFSASQPTSAYEDLRRESAATTESDDTIKVRGTSLGAHRVVDAMRTKGTVSDDEMRQQQQRRRKKRQRRNSLKSNTTTSESTATTNLSAPTNMENNNAVAWDIFRSVSRKGESFYETTTNWFQVAAKTVKVIAYIIIFVAVLTCAVVSKASLLLITQAVGNADLVR